MKFLTLSIILLLSSILYANEQYPYITPISVEEAPIYDADGDGVIDEKDRCENSKKDDKVNSFGCLNDITVILVNNNKFHNSIVVSTKSGSVVVDEENQFVNILSENKAPTVPKKISEKDIKKMFPYIENKEDVVALKYILYFEKTDTLNASSKEKILEMVDKINKRKNVIITIEGHTDTVGDSKANNVLSRQRAEYVANVLKANGVKYLHLGLESYGENNLLVDTADNIHERLNRRVEILIH